MLLTLFDVVTLEILYFFHIMRNPRFKLSSLEKTDEIFIKLIEFAIQEDRIMSSQHSDYQEALVFRSSS